MKKRILLVDDEQSVLDGLRRLLSQKYEIAVALGGSAGLDVISKSAPFELVIADMRMPQMTGLEFLTHVRQRSPGTVRMMLTGNADRQTAVDAVSVGQVFHYLNKPCDEETLIQAIEAGLELFELQKKIDQIHEDIHTAA